MAIQTEVLIVGVGNVLHGDDAFGVELAHRLLARSDLPAGCRVLETGIGGMSLVQEAAAGCRALLLLDAYQKGGVPGTLYLLKPESPDLHALDIHDRRAYFADTHYATPVRALTLLQHIGRLPDTVHILGCEPAEPDNLHWGLSESVSAALDEAEALVRRWLADVMPADV